MLNSLLLDSIIIVYFVLVIIPFKIAPSKRIHEDYLSVENTTVLRGIMAIGIIIHHMSERVTGGFLFPQMVRAGYLFVCSFFFLSGYGLIVQYQKRGDTYLKGFLRKRLLYLIIVYVLDVLLYAVFDLLLGKPHSVLEILQSLYQDGIAKNAWYMIVIIIFYVCFWLVFRFASKWSIKKKILMVFLCQIAFIGYCLLTGKGSVWYISNFGFSLGMYWACEKDRINTFAKQHYFWLFGGVTIGFVLFSVLPLGLARIPFVVEYADVIKTICRLISSPLSSAMLMTILMKIHLSGKIWKYLGKISLEIYLLHGIAYTIFRSDYIYISSEGLWVLCTIASAIIIAIPANILNQRIAQLCKREKRKSEIA